MDLAELRKKPHLSASGVNDYIDCGLQFKFGRIDRLPPEFTSDSLIYGSVIHNVLEEFHSEKMIGKRLALRDMHKTFERLWEKETEGREDIRYAEGKDAETLLREGKDLLACYSDKLPGENWKILAIEQPFSFNIPRVPVPIIGAWDLCEEDNAGTVVIVDWKTSGRSYSADEVDKNLQLTLYQLSAKSNGFRDREILLRFDVLLKLKRPDFKQYYTSRDELDERRLVKKIQEVWKGIEKGLFISNDGHWKCKGCAYQKACKEWFES